MNEQVRGAFITFEGGEGSGKSTQLRRIASRLVNAGLAVRVVREPGGTAVGEAVRGILLDPDSSGLDGLAELMLYEASRAQLVCEVIETALAAGEIVLCDRFCDSTTAYQGFGRGLSLDHIASLNAIATDGLVPDRTVLLDIDPEIGLARATALGADRLEGEDLAFHRRVREGFLRVAVAEPDRVRVVDASGDPSTVAVRVAEALADLPALAAALGGAA
ncbi:MAG: dTMP kinase [Coriobacteriia bacterium]|nr:dTMP kinase [Coriobacteriia bacterium]